MDRDRRKAQGFFYGLTLYSADGSAYPDLISGGDQFHQPIFRASAADYGGVSRLEGDWVQISFELKDFIKKMSAKGGRDIDPDNFDLAVFNIGWEALGNWELEHEMAGLSVRGTLRSFNATEYRGLYGDLQTAYASTDAARLKSHYWNYGYLEGRGALSTVSSDFFDAGFYRSNYGSELGAMSLDQLRDHWVNWGLREGRNGINPTTSCWPAAYIANNPDVARSLRGPADFAGAIAHWISWGKSEGRRCSVSRH